MEETKEQGSSENDSEKIAKIVKERLYSSQLFGYTSSDFVTVVENPVYEKLEELFNTMKQELTEKGEDPEFLEDTFTNKLLPYFTNKEGTGKFNKDFSVLDAYIHNHSLHIPANVILPEHKCHDKRILKLDPTPNIDVAANKEIFTEILHEKQTGAHLDQRLTMLKKLKTHMLVCSRNLEKLRAIE